VFAKEQWRRTFVVLPVMEDEGFRALSVVLFALLFVSGLVGVLFAPDTKGRDLEETQEAGTRRRVGSLGAETA
jgi:hypothetical protein